MLRSAAAPNQESHLPYACQHPNPSKRPQAWAVRTNYAPTSCRISSAKHVRHTLRGTTIVGRTRRPEGIRAIQHRGTA